MKRKDAQNARERLQTIEKSLPGVHGNIARFNSRYTQLRLLVDYAPGIFTDSQELFTAHLMLRQLHAWLSNFGGDKPAVVPLYGFENIDAFVSKVVRRVQP